MKKNNRIKNKKARLRRIFDLLLERFGPQDWWPGDTPFEVSVGAILTQNTNWGNVERAIANLKRAHCLSPEKIYKLELPRLAELIRPAGYFNVKAKRLMNFMVFLHEHFHGRLENLFALDALEMRQLLLGVNGIGRETADSIVLYAAEKPVFVVDAYTRRAFSRHRLISGEEDYDEIRAMFENNLPVDVQLYNEYHALIVRLGKEFCRPKPQCAKCPLNKIPHKQT